MQRHCSFLPDAEITFEANPDDITPEKVHHLLQLGVNRISLGVQSSTNSVCYFSNDATPLNKRSKPSPFYKTPESKISASILFLAYRDSNFLIGNGNWSKLSNSPIAHLSAYSLMYEEGTPLYYARQRGIVQECDDETSLAMFQSLTQHAKAAGFEQYEISNYARPGYRSRHNSSYWQGIPYLGLGPGRPFLRRTPPKTSERIQPAPIYGGR